MTHDDYAQLLRSARSVLERYMFDGEDVRDDVAEICMKLDDVLGAQPSRLIEEETIAIALDRAVA
jgi:hypothetical protein